MIGREQLRCTGCMRVIDASLAQLVSDELANMAPPPGDPEGHWRDELVKIQPGNDPQFKLRCGDPCICPTCVRNAWYGSAQLQLVAA